MGSIDETVRFNLDDNNRREISETLTTVYRSPDEKEYSPVNWIIGYVLGGDPAHVPRYDDVRNQICKYERGKTVEELIRYYLKGNGVNSK